MRALPLARAACIGICVIAPALGVPPRPRTPYETPAAVADPESQPPRSRLRPDSIAALIAARDVFRVSRQPAMARYTPTAPNDAAPPPPAPPAPPPHTLAGIMLGQEAEALLDGVPGAGTTRVVRTGDRVGDFTVSSILPGSVTLTGRDTTITLRLRTPSP